MIAAIRPAAGGWHVVEERHDSSLGRWRIVLAIPREPLARHVEAVWTSAGEGVYSQEDILPRSRAEVLFCLGKRHWLRRATEDGGDCVFDTSFVSGLQERLLRVESPPDSSMAGIRLRPEGIAAFLRDSPAAIAGSVVDLGSVLGPGVEDLRDQMLNASDLRQCVLLLAASVERHLAGAAPVSHAIQSALASLHARHGNVAIRDLVRESGFSHRYLTERFRAEIGMAPKMYGRLIRFERAVLRLGGLGAVRWADFALDCGFYDQPHLVREFRHFAGASPTEVFRRLAPDGLALLSEEEAAGWHGFPETTAPAGVELA